MLRERCVPDMSVWVTVLVGLGKGTADPERGGGLERDPRLADGRLQKSVWE